MAFSPRVLVEYQKLKVPVPAINFNHIQPQEAVLYLDGFEDI